MIYFRWFIFVISHLEMVWGTFFDNLCNTVDHLRLLLWYSSVIYTIFENLGNCRHVGPLGLCTSLASLYPKFCLSELMFQRKPGNMDVKYLIFIPFYPCNNIAHSKIIWWLAYWIEKPFLGCQKVVKLPRSCNACKPGRYSQHFQLKTCHKSTQDSLLY